MEQRNEPKTAELIKNARYCCGDIKCEGEKDCGDYCLDGRDDRNGDLRWCRQWLVHDLADRLEQLERENAKLTARAEKAEAERDAELSKAVRAVLVEIMGRLASFENYFSPCNFCEYENGERVECKQCYENGNFKYRGCAKAKQSKEVEE